MSMRAKDFGTPLVYTTWNLGDAVKWDVILI